MKIGLPRLRLSRKLLLVTLGVTVLLGGTGVTALYFGGKGLIMEGGVNAIGGECTDVQTMVVKTPSDHLWLRKFIRMENKSGQERVRTALRIAGLLAKKHAVDLIHVSVLDARGPDKRAEMRARAIGAEVLIALKPANLPEMKSPAMASYFEGPVSDEGRFYGDKVIIDIDEIGAMMTAMRTVEDKPDCVNPNAGAEDAAKKNDHGKKNKKDAAKPHGEEPADADGKGAKDGAESAHDEEPVREKSFLDSMLSMVGLGGSDVPEVESNEPVAEEPADSVDNGHDENMPADEDQAGSRTEPEEQARAVSH